VTIVDMSVDQLINHRRSIAADLSACDKEIARRLQASESNRQAEAAARRVLAERDLAEVVPQLSPVRPWAVALLDADGGGFRLA